MNVSYYKDEPSPDKTDQDGYETLQMFRKSEIDTDRREHDAGVNANKNKNKLRSMVLVQHNKVIQAIIKAHKDYSNNQYNLLWILKRIKLASKEPGMSNDILYPQLVNGCTASSDSAKN